MTSLINALDNYTPYQYGEKGHFEYSWSNSIQEKIVQFNFQVIRTDKSGLNKLSSVLDDLLFKLYYQNQNGSLSEKEVSNGYLSILYKMIGNTRDIIDGKGEYTLAFMMIYIWHKHNLELAKFALKCFIDLGDNSVHPYGSWKDIKYFCEYCREQGENIDFPLIQYAISLMNDQIKNDYEKLQSNDNNITLAAKWAPREKSSFGWLYQSMATNYFSEFMLTANTDERHTKALLKCKTEYRKVLSCLNRKIDTLQIKQCNQEWKNINFNNVTSISLTKQRKAFLNKKNNGEIRFPENEDRILCSKNFNTYIQKTINSSQEIKGKRLSMTDFTKQAIQILNDSNNELEKNLLNSQWCDNSSQTETLGKMIAMVDVSDSMEGEPMNAAISLGIRIAEKSVLGNRIMTFSSKPTWVNLENVSDFVSKVQKVKSAQWYMNTNFYAALDMILDAIILNKMEAVDVKDMVLVVLSDMQIDCGDSCDKKSLYDKMEEKYAAAGVRVCGVPYKPPSILFWNLKSTNGFPSLANQPNVSMMSGFSPSIINLFCENGLTSLQNFTPWILLNNNLNNERYNIMDIYFYKLIQN
jgi:hypothetical protein